MSEIEAIKSLEDFLEHDGLCCCVEEDREVIKKAIVALREKAERDKYCKDCKCPRCASGYWRVI